MSLYNRKDTVDVQGTLYSNSQLEKWHIIVRQLRQYKFIIFIIQFTSFEITFRVKCFDVKIFCSSNNAKLYQDLHVPLNLIILSGLGRVSYFGFIFEM